MKCQFAAGININITGNQGRTFVGIDVLRNIDNGIGTANNNTGAVNHRFVVRFGNYAQIFGIYGSVFNLGNRFGSVVINGSGTGKRNAGYRHFNIFQFNVGFGVGIHGNIAARALNLAAGNFGQSIVGQLNILNTNVDRSYSARNIGIYQFKRIAVFF